MKQLLVLIALSCSLAVTGQSQPASKKLRVLVLTDIENEPDDAQSLVRFLTYVNQWDVEGIIATTSVHQQKRVAPERIRRIVEAYGKVRNNLLLHEKGYPETEYLLSRIKASVPRYGLDAVGPGNDSEGSEHIIATVDKNDERPVWVPVWGEPTAWRRPCGKYVRRVRPKRLMPSWPNSGCIPYRIRTIRVRGFVKHFPPCFLSSAPVSTTRAGMNILPGGVSVAMFFRTRQASPGRFQHRQQHLAGCQHPQKSRPAGGGAPAYGLHHGRRHAQLLWPD